MLLDRIFTVILSLLQLLLTAPSPFPTPDPAAAYGAFGIPAEAYTQRYLAENAAQSLPYAMTFERTGGAGENTHLYDGHVPNADLWLRVHTYPFDERIRSVELYLPVPDAEADRPDALDAFTDCAALALRAALPDADLTAFTDSIRATLPVGRDAATLTADGLLCIAQVQESLYANFLPPRYTLSILPAPAPPGPDGRPSFAGFQADASILLARMGQSRTGWQAIDVTGRDLSGVRSRYDMLGGPYSAINLLVYTDTAAPYRLQAFSGRFSATDDDPLLAEKLATFADCFTALAAQAGFAEDAVRDALAPLAEMHAWQAPAALTPVARVSDDGRLALSVSGDVSVSCEAALFSVEAVLYHTGTPLFERYFDMDEV